MSPFFLFDRSEREFLYGFHTKDRQQVPVGVLSAGRVADFLCRLFSNDADFSHSELVHLLFKDGGIHPNDWLRIEEQMKGGVS